MPNGNQIASRSAKHGSYVADSVTVRDYVMAYYGDVNQSYRALLEYVIQISGFGDVDYWNDMEAIDLLIVLADVSKFGVADMTKHLADFEDQPASALWRGWV